MVATAYRQVFFSGFSETFLHLRSDCRCDCSTPKKTRLTCDNHPYVHLFFDRRQLLMSSGVIPESYYPGAQAIA